VTTGPTLASPADSRQDEPVAHDEQLADRVRDLLPAAREQRMFGGLALLVDDRMAVCVTGDGGLLLAAPDTAAAARWVGLADVVPMRMGARTSDTWVHVLAPALADDAALRQWVERGLAAARARPRR
jgi:TfoX/Sxy family transcriptional regulator of competence genes